MKRLLATTAIVATSSVSGTFSASAEAVPEPASVAILGLGLLGLGLVRQRRA